MVWFYDSLFCLSSISLLLPKQQVDPETGDYVRNSSGFCVQAGVNEPGEMVGAIRQHVRSSDFDGYTDAKASSKKVRLSRLSNV